MNRQLEVTEGVTGMWFYHISENGAFTRGLCGAHTMKTNMPLAQWGHVSKHIGERYCSKCAELAGLTQDRAEVQP